MQIQSSIDAAASISPMGIAGDEALLQPVPDAPPRPDYTKVLQAHQKAATFLQVIGYVCLFAAAISFIFGMFALIWMFVSNPGAGLVSLLYAAVPFLIIVGLTCGVGALGFGLAALRPIVKIPAAIFFIVCLGFFPLGTFIGSIGLWIVLGKAGKHIFQPEYQEAMRIRDDEGKVG